MTQHGFRALDTPAPGAAAGPAISTILIVDDQPQIVELLREFFEGRGHAVVTADSVTGARAVLQSRPLDLVLLDLRLPDGSGVDLLRAAPSTAPPPEVVLVTGHATLDSAILAVEAGAAGYVLKPVDLDRLAALVDRVLERRRLALENADLQAQLAGRLRETEALLAIARTLGETLDIREAFRRICRELVRLTGADTSAAYLYDAAVDLLQPYAAYHVPPEYLAKLATTGLPVHAEGFYLPVWQERQPVHSDDVARDPRFHHPMFRAIPHQSGLVLPLFIDGEVAGAFYLVWWRARRTFEPSELTLLQNIAQQVGLLLRNARLFEAGERDRRRLQLLYEVSRRLAAVHDTDELLALIVNEAVTLLEVDAGGLRLREGDDLVVGARTASAAPLMSRERLRMGESLSGIVAATGQPVVVEDLATDARYDAEHRRGALSLGYHGFAGVPLQASGGVIGTLNVYSRLGRRFQSDELSLLTALADQASLAIEKSRLLQATRAREREVTQLYTITTQLASNLGLERVLDLIAGDVRALLRCDAAGVYGHDPVRGGLRLRRSLNLDPGLPGDGFLRPGEGVAGRAFSERRPVWTRDQAAEPRRSGPAAAGSVGAPAPRALLAVPILRRETVYGVLIGSWFDPHDCTADEIRLLSTLAAQAAIAIDNSILFEETRTQQVRLNQIFESTSDGIMLVDRAGAIVAANRRSATLLGLDAPPTGRPLTELLAGDRGRGRDDWRRLIERLPTLEADGRRGDLEDGGGGRVLHWTAEPTLDAGGERVGITLTMQDVTREREVNQMKSDFVSFVTHQLRTPLAGIKWLLELAAEDPALPAEARSYVADSREAVQRLITLVNDLLDISRLESGRLTITPVPVDLRRLTQDVLGEADALIAARGHAVSITGDGTAIADEQLLRQVVLNLVSNAAKYTPARGRIEIAIDSRGPEVEWSITDSGLGIPAGARARLFEKFYRADNVQTLETEGTGLGLYLVRLIVEQLRGRIDWTSVEGQGTTFRVTMPGVEAVG